MTARIDVSPRMLRDVVAASTIGNALDFFDFVAFAFLSATIGEHFFPAENPAAPILLALATFGAGFAMRPLGAIFFGVYGDRIGRKRMLYFTLLLMAVGSAVTGLVPTYAAIGVSAAVLLVLGRLVEGFSAGGEYGGATTLLVEYAPRGSHVTYASFQSFSQGLGVACAGVFVSVLAAVLSPARFDAWGWRVPFLVGIMVGPLGIYIRTRIDESPEFVRFLRCQATRRRDTQRAITFGVIRKSVYELLRTYPKQIVVGLSVICIGTTSVYTYQIYVVIFAEQHLGISASLATIAGTSGTALTALLSLASARLADRYGKGCVLFAGVLVYAVVAIITYTNFVHSRTFDSMLLLELALAAPISTFFGLMPAVLTDLFPVSERSTGVSVVYAFGVLIFGGFAPFINAWLVRTSGNLFSVLYYSLAGALVGAIGFWILATLPAYLPGVAHETCAVGSAGGGAC